MSNCNEYCTWIGKYYKIKLVSALNLSPDYYLLVNWLPGITSIEELSKYIDPKKLIIAHMEPYINLMKDIPDMWKEPDRTKFLKVLDHKTNRNIMEWHISMGYQELLKMDSSLISLKKDNRISVIMSSKNIDPGHKLRLSFIKNLIKDKEFSQEIIIYDKKETSLIYEFNLDIYGSVQDTRKRDLDIDEKDNKKSNIQFKGLLPYQTKDQGLFTYKYHINAENNIIENYNTEKIVDGILSLCLVFYYGSSSLDKIIDPRAYIKLPLEDTLGSIKIIKNTIRGNEWDKRLPYIKQAKYDLLTKYQLFPFLEDVISKI